MGASLLKLAICSHAGVNHLGDLKNRQVWVPALKKVGPDRFELGAEDLLRAPGGSAAGVT